MISNNNGVGPVWFPSWLRQYLTTFSLKFFRERSWIKHDDAYCIGGTEEDRKIADKIFLLDLKEDLLFKTKSRYLFGIVVAYIYYFNLRIFGKSAYHYTG